MEAANITTPGTLVWSRCATSGFRRATVVSYDESSDNVLVDAARDEGDIGGQKQVRRADVRPFFDDAKPQGCADNTELVYLDDANILNNLHLRFQTDNIYTYTANVLLAVNPYKQLPHLYTNAKMMDYKNIRNVGSQPPHPFAIADMAYRYMLREWRDQALVISGESGAGKTETAKFTMRYLADASRTDAAHGGRIQDKIINATPILEAFGNAQTVRNRNSSRFGKYNEMHFNRVGSLVSAGIKTYLLETARVVSQQEGEQNYHVFYQMLCGLGADELDLMQLDSQTKYQLLYTEKAQVPDAASQDFSRAREEFDQLRQALDIVGVDAEVRGEVFEVVAALIHLGEVQFGAAAGSDNFAQPDFDGAEDSASSQTALVELLKHDELGSAAELLGLSESRLLQVLKWKEVRVPSRKSHIRCPRTKSQSYQTLHSIIRILYKRLFEHIVQCINASSAATTATPHQEGSAEDGSYQADHVSIGTLDIYGFERLGTNSFEQLCINLANERLQQFFVEEVLQAEQKMYADEQIRIDMFDLPDSKPVVVGIQSVMSILDDHSKRFFKNLTSKGDDVDQKFCENVYRDHMPAKQNGPAPTGPLLPLKMKASRLGTTLGLSDGFVVRHYAGEVQYSTNGWITKNNDALVPEVESLLMNSEKSLVRSLQGPEGNDPVTGERFTSVSSKYIVNLNDLLTTLHRCKLHYIRCFNPNNKRLPGTFDKKYVLDQIIQCGTVELVKIMHNGFPNRCKLDEIRNRFAKLLPADFERYRDRDFCEAIMLAFEIDSSQWTVGTSRLFLKAGQLRVLEHLLDSKSMASKEMIAKIKHQFLRKKWRAVRCAIRFAIWLPKHARKLRTVAVRTALRKTCYIYVRVFRWLRRARTTLYGVAPPQPVFVEPPVKQSKYKAGLSLWAAAGYQVPCPRHQQLFIALNRNEVQDYMGVLQNHIDGEKKVHDNVLTLSQKNTTESVMFYDGEYLMSARLDPKPFIEKERRSQGSCLSDIRYIDVAETGRAMVQKSELSPDNEIICMCQHPRNSQIFASCHRETINVWSWFGTDVYDSDKMAVVCDSIFVRDSKAIMYGMFFLSDVPEWIASQDGDVLFLLTGQPHRPWLTIQIIAVFRNTHRILLERNIGLDGSLLEAARTGHIVFQVSHSDRILIVAGKGAAIFYEIRRFAPTCATGETQLGLSLINHSKVEDLEQLNYLNFSSCLCLPPPKNCSGMGAIDWIILGDSDGDLFGFLWLADGSDRVVLSVKHHGRFSSTQTKHDRGVPISLLIPTFGSRPESHHRSIKEKGFAYTMFLEGVGYERDRFFSFGDNGKLLSWSLGKSGWTARVEDGIDELFENGQPCLPEKGRQFVSAHSSRLVPNVLVAMDQKNNVICLDTMNMNKDARAPLEAMCCFGGA